MINEQAAEERGRSRPRGLREKVDMLMDLRGIRDDFEPIENGLVSIYKITGYHAGAQNKAGGLLRHVQPQAVKANMGFR